METWIIDILAVFVTSVFLATFIIPKILLISFRKRLFDDHDERKIHEGTVPRLGGLAFNPIIFFSVILIFGINIQINSDVFLTRIQQSAAEMSFEFCALFLLYVVGIADDLIGVKYRAKFVVQILCGILLISGGLWIDNLYGLLGIEELPEFVGYPLTILVVVFFINAINLIDGVDGLASGLCIAASFLYGCSFIYLGHLIYAAMAFATLGVLLPFFYFNVFGKADHRKKIFMGDTGSLTLGFILCIYSIKLLFSISHEVKTYPNPFILAFAPMMVPCFDVIRVFFRRIRNHKSPFLPDRTHIHHKLLDLGLSSRLTMVIIVGLSIALTIMNVVLSEFININLLVLGNIAAWTLLNIWISQIIRRRKAAASRNAE